MPLSVADQRGPGIGREYAGRLVGDPLSLTLVVGHGRPVRDVRIGKARLFESDHRGVGFPVQIHLIHEGSVVGGVELQAGAELRAALPVAGARELEGIVAFVHRVGIVGLADEEVVIIPIVGPIIVLGQRAALEPAVDIHVAAFHNGEVVKADGRGIA